MKTYSQGRTLPAYPWEVVSVGPIPAHDRGSLAGVEVRCMPSYSPFPIGRKAEIVRRQRAFADTLKDML